MSRRRYIKNFVKNKRIKDRLDTFEIIVVNLLVLSFFVIIFVFYNSIGSFYVSFYDNEDIQSFNIDTKGLKAVYETSLREDISLEKLLVAYAKSNNYFSEDTIVSEFESIEINSFLEKIRLAYFFLDKENKQIYKAIKSVNEDIKTLPFNQANFEDVLAINCFSVIKENLGTMFLEREVSTKTIEVISITEGVVESVGYKGDNGLQVVIQTENNNKFVYTNLGDISSNLKKGVSVKSGDTLGTMGNTAQIKEEIAYERSKLGVYIVLAKGYLGQETYLNPYPFLYLKALGY